MNAHLPLGLDQRVQQVRGELRRVSMLAQLAEQGPLAGDAGFGVDEMTPRQLEMFAVLVHLMQPFSERPLYALMSPVRH